MDVFWIVARRSVNGLSYMTCNETEYAKHLMMICEKAHAYILSPMEVFFFFCVYKGNKFVQWEETFNTTRLDANGISLNHERLYLVITTQLIPCSKNIFLIKLFTQQDLSGFKESWIMSIKRMILNCWIKWPRNS